MKPPTYIPQPDSVAGRVCAFFKLHPDEELSAKDIELKFDAKAASVSGLLQRCFETQLLKRVSTRGELVVAAGERLTQTNIKAGPVTMPALPPFGAARQRQPRRPLPPLDVAALTVVIKAPPPKHTNRPSTDWEALLSRLQVGQAIEDLPVEYYGAAAKAAQKWAQKNNAKFEIRKLPDEKCGLYRVE
jgi:hypothetical protein